MAQSFIEARRELAGQRGGARLELRSPQRPTATLATVILRCMARLLAVLDKHELTLADEHLPADALGPLDPDGLRVRPHPPVAACSAL